MMNVLVVGEGFLVPGVKQNYQFWRMQQAQQQQALNNLNNQEVAHYNKMRQEYAEIFRVFLDIEDERKEHTLVLEAIKNIDPQRRCWRLIGGVLVERRLDEVSHSLKENLELLEKTGQNYNNAMKQKEKELLEFELKHNLRPNQPTQQQQQQQQSAKNGQGVLA